MTASHHSSHHSPALTIALTPSHLSNHFPLPASLSYSFLKLNCTVQLPSNNHLHTRPGSQVHSRSSHGSRAQSRQWHRSFLQRRSSSYQRAKDFPCVVAWYFSQKARLLRKRSKFPVEKQATRANCLQASISGSLGSPYTTNFGQPFQDRVPLLEPFLRPPFTAKP